MMNIGTQTNSLVNHLYSRMTVGAPEPEVGMGATLLSWTDRRAATVVSWDAKKQIVGVTSDDYKRVDNNGMSEEQEYEFTSRPNAIPSYYRRAKDGAWVQVRFNEETKRWVNARSGGLIIGKRDHYHDFSH